MKKILIAALFMAILAAASVSGCTLPIGGQTSPTPTVIYGPVPSALPTATPTPTPGPAVANSRPSDEVKIITSPIDYKVVSDQKTRDGRQFENISLIIANDDTETVKNVVLAVTIIDEFSMNNLVYQEFKIGDLTRGEYKPVALVTNPHSPSTFIKMSIKLQWGDYGEYYSMTPFEHTYTFMM
jgi:hypothetical protein